MKYKASDIDIEFSMNFIDSFENDFCRVFTELAKQ